ncbi:MAG: hypothetical protein VKO00_00900 [Cyanobacteriota bacterium]|nr:hypothetical protein [Cyanobacteriota bacterium]
MLAWLEHPPQPQLAEGFAAHFQIQCKLLPSSARAGDVVELVSPSDEGPPGSTALQRTKAAHLADGAQRN